MIFYNIIRWAILLVLMLIVLLGFIVESPATLLRLLKTPLQEQNITYGEMNGGLLSGFTLKDINYNNQVEAKEVTLKVDFEALKDRKLIIENLVLKDAKIDNNFLTTLIDSNNSDKNSSDKNITLPFDRVLVKNADISIKDTGYQNYYINSAKLHLSDVKTDMKQERSGSLTFLLDSNMTQADIKASFKNETYDISGDIEANREFIAPFVNDYNITLLVNPKFSLKAKGNLDAVNYESNIYKLSLKQNEYLVKSKQFRTKGVFNIRENRIDNSLRTELDGNVAHLKLDALTHLDLDDINSSLGFDIDGKVELKRRFIPAQLAEQNITIKRLPQIALLAKGDMKKVRFTSTIKGLKLKQNKLALHIKDLELKGEAKPIDGDINTRLLTHFDSSVADGKIALNSNLNYKDINNSLHFDINSNFTTDKEYLNKILKDNNLTIRGKSQIALSAKGDMKKVEFKTTIDKFRAKQNKININIKQFLLKGYAKPIVGDVNIHLLTALKSTVADGDIDADTKLNFHDINSSLSFDTKVDFMVHKAYLNNILKDSNITIHRETPLKVTAKGDINRVNLKLDVVSKILAQNILSDLTLKSHKVVLDLKEHRVKGEIKLNSKAKNLALTIKSRFNGDYTKPKEMRLKGQIALTNFNAFGINLNSFTPLNIDINKLKKSAVVKLNSKLIHLNAKSSNLDHILFDIKTGNIYPSKIVKVPDEFKKRFVKVNLKGDVTISKEYIKLKGSIESNRHFKAFIDARNRKDGLKVDLHTKELKIHAQGNIEKQNIDASIEVNSIQRVQQEFTNLYPFEVFPANGSIKLKAKMRGEKISANLTSPKIELEGFNVEHIDIDANYQKELITINKLNLETTEFEDNRLNRKFYLNKKGRIHLGERRDVELDIHPNILVDLKGTKENLNGSVSIDSLPLGYPDYGEVILTTNINYHQIGKKRRVIGNIDLKDLKLSYEAKFLDPANDSDVIVISKKDKKKKEDNSFLENTYIDVDISARDAQYKTKDIDLTFRVDLKAKKEFGKNLGMLGRIKEINGVVEQPPKIFNVVDSSVVFRGLKEINPLLDITVQHELPDVLITINIHGDANRPKLDFSSEPQMPKKDILSYLLFGVSTAKLSDKDTNLGREAELFIMNQAARDLAYELDLDRVLIKDDGTGEGYAVQVGKKIGKKSIFVIENSKEGNSFILEYNINKNIKVEVAQHQKTVPSQSIDVFFRKKFR